LKDNNYHYIFLLILVMNMFLHLDHILHKIYHQPHY